MKGRRPNKRTTLQVEVTTNRDMDTINPAIIQPALKEYQDPKERKAEIKRHQNYIAAIDDYLPFLKEATLRRLANKAIAKIEELMESENDAIALAASQDILNRTIGKPATAKVAPLDAEANETQKQVTIVMEERPIAQFDRNHEPSPNPNATPRPETD